MKVSNAILKNAESLLVTSLSLLAIGRKHHAAHFAALCLEECAKCLMYIDGAQELFSEKDKRSHSCKEKLTGFFHYLAGMLSVVYYMKSAFDSGALGEETKNFKIIVDYSLELSGMKGIQGLTRCIKQYIELPKNNNLSPFKVDNIRKDSVYVDVSDGVLLTPKKRVNDKVIQDLINDARFGVSLLNMALHKKFMWAEFIETFPVKHKNPELEAKKLLRSMKNKAKKHQAN